MTGDLIYKERVTSNRTQAFFLLLTSLFAVLFKMRVKTRNRDPLASVFLLFFSFFLFYSINYRSLMIHITSEILKLKFGIFTWKVPLDNIEGCRFDDLPRLMRMGGAGIHFMNIRNRYRASFNFLEHPRVVVALRKKVGQVQDISFSTRRPDTVIRLINEVLARPS